MQPIRSMFAGSVMDTSMISGANASIMNASMMGSVTDEFHSIGGPSRLPSREGVKSAQGNYQIKIKLVMCIVYL